MAAREPTKGRQFSEYGVQKREFGLQVHATCEELEGGSGFAARTESDAIEPSFFSDAEFGSAFGNVQHEGSNRAIQLIREM